MKSAFLWSSERVFSYKCFPLHWGSYDCGVLWHFPLTIDCSVSLKGNEPFWDWCDKTWQEIPLNKTNYTLEMCWTDWKQFGHQGQWKVLRRLRAMTFSSRFYLKCFDAQLGVNQWWWVLFLGCPPSDPLLQRVCTHVYEWAESVSFL